MFIKIFIFILLATYVVSDKPNVIQKQNFDDRWKDIQKTFQEFYEQSKKTFEEILDEVNRRTTSVIEMSKKKLTELKAQYDQKQINGKSDKEERMLWEVRIQELKNQSMETMNTINDKYELLKKKTENVIRKQQEIWQSKIKEFLEREIRKIDEGKSKKT